MTLIEPGTTRATHIAPARTRAAHIAWAKARAIAYLAASPSQAIMSLVCDLAKHPETVGLLDRALLMRTVKAGADRASARAFIEAIRVVADQG
jgi:hypothetical protein